MQIDWWTLGLQAVNFLILAWLLHRFLYRPVQDVIARRRQRMEEDLEAVQAERDKVEAERVAVERDRAEIHAERDTILTKAHDEIENQRQQMIDSARAEAEARLAAARQSFEAERAEALTEAKKQVAGLAASMTRRLVMEIGPAAPPESALERVESALRGLPEVERLRLARALTDGDGGATVVTAAPLSPEALERWRSRLASALDVNKRLEFTVDSSILGGVELRLPHTRLAFSLSDQIDRAGKMLEHDEPTL